MEQKQVGYKRDFWLNPIIKELRRQHISLEKLEKDLKLSTEELKSLHEDGECNIKVYLKMFEYLGLRLRIINEVGRPLEHRRKFNVSNAYKLSKIDVQGSYINLTSLHDARARAVNEMESLGDYKTWGATSHRRLQVAADTVMLINILEDLFEYAKRPDRS